MLLPARRLTLRSALPPGQLLGRLTALIGPGLPYAGEVTTDAFTARRRRTLARFGLPVARGVVRADDAGSALEIDLRLDPLFAALHAVWAVIMLAASAALVNASLRAGAFDPRSLGPAALALFVHAMVHVSFAGEVAVLRRWLGTLAKGRPLPGVEGRV